MSRRERLWRRDRYVIGRSSFGCGEAPRLRGSSHQTFGLDLRSLRINDKAFAGTYVRVKDEATKKMGQGGESMLAPL